MISNPGVLLVDPCFSRKQRQSFTKYRTVMNLFNTWFMFRKNMSGHNTPILCPLRLCIGMWHLLKIPCRVTVT